MPAKKDVALALLESSTVLIHLDPRTEEVRVPPWFKKQPQLVLEIGLNMPVPIPDLSVDDDAVSCTLSFSRSPFFCFIPWGAVYALVGSDGRSMVWPDDVPPEVVAQAEEARQKETQKKTRRAHLRAVPDDGEEQELDEASGDADEPEDIDAASTAEEDADETETAEAAEAAKAAEAAEAAEEGASERSAPTEPQASLEPLDADEEKAAGGNGKRKLPPYLRVVK